MWTRDEQPRRFFVTIMAADASRLRALTTLGLDLFAACSDEAGHRVDGLITIEDVVKVVDAGYQVLVGDSDRPRRTHRYIGLEEWQSSMLGDLEEQRRKQE
jgi:hypothetical protein